MKPAIGWIGLGLMGRPMGMNLLKAGYTLTVWNRSASRADELVGAGAKLANQVSGFFPQAVIDDDDREPRLTKDGFLGCGSPPSG